ncbi:hypothetical protein BME96_09035 [Virgibacillus halodenitrificans]|uniref:Uncharacterized protein n=1 Tax=Virgibacillus halodenitrificans TaxID=1482 RepID=A0AAC9IZ78_VIRHA|nr:hypothetical protein [Virgibacillus halodenitrificans]APC48302.1 hypothetical protein BME96_09035 [Virgibacillus halodenitrificans]
MIETMDFQVTNIQFVNVGEEQKVNIHFRGVDPNNQINMNGYVPVTTVEFFQHSGSTDSLGTLVKGEVLERLNGPAA